MIRKIDKVNVFHNQDFVATLQMTPEGAGCVANLDVMLCLIVV